MIKVNALALLLYMTLFPDTITAQDLKCGQVNTETLDPLSTLNTFPVFGGRHLPAITR